MKANKLNLEFNKNWIECVELDDDFIDSKIPTNIKLMIDKLLSDELAKKSTPKRNSIYYLSDKLNVNVLSVSGNYFIFEKDGYLYRHDLYKISDFIISKRNLTDDSYIKYINDNFFLNTDLIADGFEVLSGLKFIKILNKKTMEYRCISKRFDFDVDFLIRNTSKKYRIFDRIKKSLGENYDYSKTFDSISQKKAIVTCKYHGDFNISIANTFGKGCGCPVCGYSAIGFGKKNFILKCTSKNINPSIYLIECNDANEKFYKIGITTRSMKARCYGIPYKNKTLIELNGDPSEIYDLENFLHKKYSSNLYVPEKKFNGRTECFLFDDIDSVIEFIKESYRKLINL